MILLHHKIGVFSLDDLDAGTFIIQNLHAVGTQVHPTGFRIPGNQRICRTDKATAILRIHERHWKIIKIDPITF